jgi:RND family efflux transporter MFP subunit
MTRKTSILSIFGAIIAVLFALVLWRVSGSTGSSQAKRPERPLAVDTVQVKVQPMPILLQAVGQVQSEHSVLIRPQVNGILQAVYFTEGQSVKKGDKLFLIDPSTYRAAVESARSAWQNAKSQQDRLAPLEAKDFVTPQEFEAARSAAEQAQAALTQAEINLAHTEITAPIAGRTGSLSVKAGNLVASTDAAALVSINQMSPILVQYSVPQAQLPLLREYQARHSIRVFVTHEDGSGDLGSGELVFIDNAINADSGTVMLKARVDNAALQLWPGQYVGVRTQLAMQPDALVVPVSAVQSGQDGNYVYVVEQGKAATRAVKVDRQVGDLAVIAGGLSAGETVVARAPRNLRPGLEVKPIEADSLRGPHQP